MVFLPNILASFSPYEVISVIIGSNLHAKLTKIEIKWSCSRFKHCSEYNDAPIHMKSWPKVKLGKVGVGSNYGLDEWF